MGACEFSLNTCGKFFRRLTIWLMVSASPWSQAAMPRTTGAKTPSSANSHSPSTKAASTCGKKFQKAMVISGGGISPGIALGLLAGARAAGQKPDVLLTTCGASLGGAISNSFPDPAKAKQYVTSREFHKFLLQYARVGQTNPMQLGLKLGLAWAEPGFVPDIYAQNIMDIPETLPRLLPRQDYTSAAGETRLITLAAKANFKPSDAGVDISKIDGKYLYKQTYFTDKDTAQALKGLPASIKRNFPDSPISASTQVRSDVSTVQAARASISDPFLINPAKIKNEYYFAGAMDLFPIETAQAVACEVVATSPSGGYSRLEDLAVNRGFGFKQSDRAAQLEQYKGVKWVEMNGAADLAMDPDVDGLAMVSRIPVKYEDFVAQIEKQYDFGYQQALAVFCGWNQEARSQNQNRPTATLNLA